MSYLGFFQTINLRRLSPDRTTISPVIAEKSPGTAPRFKSTSIAVKTTQVGYWRSSTKRMPPLYGMNRSPPTRKPWTP